MNISPESLTQRNKIIDEHRRVILTMRAIEKEIERLLRENDPRWKDLEKERNAFYVQIEPLVEKYWEWVPQVKLSQCPFCGKDLWRNFDPVDLKGFWWMDRTQRPKPEPEHCEHFRLLLGAVNLNGRPVEGGLFECRPGPDVPFVIGRILELPTMQAGVLSVNMHCGYTAYPIAYFSKTPPPFKALTQPWAQKEYRFELANGKTGWDVRDDQYDYDLAPWIKKGKFKCFLEGIKGVAKPQVIIDNELRYGEV